MNLPDGELWRYRVQCALGGLEAIEVHADMPKLMEAVAARFASQFVERDRQYEKDSPYWHNRVRDAVDDLVTRKEATRRRIEVPAPAQTAPAPEKVLVVRLTAAGRRGIDQACERAETRAEPPLEAAPKAVAPGSPEPAEADKPKAEDQPKPDPVLAGVITPPLRDTMVQKTEAAAAQEVPSPIMIELNLGYQPSGIGGAQARVKELWQLVGGSGEPRLFADQFMAGDLTTAQIKCLVSADAVPQFWPQRAIYRIWPDFEVHPQIDASSSTVKAIAAQRSFDSFGDGIVWAVVDSGIEGTHPHFKEYDTLTDPSVSDLHKDFTGGSSPLADTDGHGTHVAGIIAGGLHRWAAEDVVVVEKRLNDPQRQQGEPIMQPRITDPDRLAGMAPRAKLVSLKVLGGPGDDKSRVSRVMDALAYVREKNAGSERVPRIHGVNLSLGYQFDAQWYACGQSPLCVEVDKTVRSGVVVVVAAGNSGYVSLTTAFKKDSLQFTADMTINDPGNTESAITVGSTHRSSPHTFGVSYFSSRGPTGDGRRKPDLVAPGERITSAAAGTRRSDVANQITVGDEVPVYIDESGTSMAAPHVSGAIAAFLSVRREFVSKPEVIKRIFVDSATSLARDPAFQGSGLVDLLRALQSV